MSIERRDLILAAGATAFLGALTSRAALSADLKIEVPDFTAVLPDVIVPASPTPEDEKKLWGELYEKLVQRQPSLAEFNTSFELGVVGKLSDIKNQETNKFSHNPRLVEPLLGEIASLLDRCLAYRREGGELEIQGMAAGLVRMNSDLIGEIDYKLLETDKGADSAAILAQNLPNVTKLFENAVFDKNFGEATGLQAKIYTTINQIIADSLRTRSGLMKLRLKATQDAERQLLARHDVTGNAHNFVERYQRLRELFESDIQAAYKRALAAQHGLKTLFGFDEEVPKVIESGYLEKLVNWTKSAMRSVSLLGEREIELVRRIPIELTAESLSLDLKDSFKGLTNVRLRELAMSYGASDDAMNSLSRQNSLFSVIAIKANKDAGPDVVIPFSEVAYLSGSAEPKWISGPILFNVDPRGEWNFRIAPTGHNFADPVFPIKDNVKRLFLHVRGVATVDTELATSWWLSENRL